MKRKTEVSVKYGAVVTADSELEAVRAAGCLCLRCTRFVGPEDVKRLVVDKDPRAREAHEAQMKKAFNCPIAQRIFEACLEGDVAAPVSRCPMFVERN